MMALIIFYDWSKIKNFHTIDEKLVKTKISSKKDIQCNQLIVSFMQDYGNKFKLLENVWIDKIKD